LKIFADKIIEWYLEHKRDLPWRNIKDPYLIWLSEIILQQTRVDQGLAYYIRFATEFPTINELASAPEEKVLKLWQGLGYYSRARNLHTAAQYIHRELGGIFPSSYDEIRKLKGVGEYTAAAIASFAFDQCHAVVDGNVYRVLSRVFGVETPIDSTKGRKQFTELASSLIDKEHPGTYNQAVMEFGATHCKPRNAGCNCCPLSTMCVAKSKGTVDELPVKSKSTRTRDRFFNYLVLEHKGSYLLNKRTGKDIWQNLYDFPLVETAKAITEEELIASPVLRELAGGNGFVIRKVSRTYKHILSHQVIYARFWEISLKKSYKHQDNRLAVSEPELHDYAVPRLVETYLTDRKK
jgi:A/G-specific adenine glycosylase